MRLKAPKCIQDCRAFLSDYSVGWQMLEMNYAGYKDEARVIGGATHVKGN